jgi:hypothetical protein
MRIADSVCSPCLSSANQVLTSGLSTDDSRSGNVPLGSWFSLIQSQLIGGQPATAGARVNSGRGPCSPDEDGSFATELVSIGHELGTDLT